MSEFLLKKNNIFSCHDEGVFRHLIYGFIHIRGPDLTSYVDIHVTLPQAMHATPLRSVGAITKFPVREPGTIQTRNQYTGPGSP
jgi:hypothetical protein